VESISNPILASTAKIDASTDSDSLASLEQDAENRSKERGGAMPADPTVLDIYLSADCFGFVSCNRIMIGSCAFFYSILLSDMSGDKVGPVTIAAVFGLCFFVVLVVLSITLYKLRRYVMWSKSPAGDYCARRCFKLTSDIIAFWRGSSSGEYDVNAKLETNLTSDRNPSEVELRTIS
jgi:hypothetical protein